MSSPRVRYCGNIKATGNQMEKTPRPEVDGSGALGRAQADGGLTPKHHQLFFSIEELKRTRDAVLVLRDDIGGDAVSSCDAPNGNPPSLGEMLSLGPDVIYNLCGDIRGIINDIRLLIF